MNKSSCVLICEKSYADFVTYACVACSSSDHLDPDCSDCLSSTVCLSCATKYFYNGTCVATCPEDK